MLACTIHEKLLEVFRKSDPTGRGCFPLHNLSDTLRRADVELPSADLEQLLNKANVASDGFVRYEELLRWIFGKDVAALGKPVGNNGAFHKDPLSHDCQANQHEIHLSSEEQARHAIACGRVRLISANWLLTRRGPLDRMHAEWDADAFIEPSRAGTLLAGARACCKWAELEVYPLVIAVSYGQISNKHPDPEGFHLRRLQRFLQEYLVFLEAVSWSGKAEIDTSAAGGVDVAVFWDYASLPQDLSCSDAAPCSLNELKAVSFLYSSPHTIVLQLKSLPWEKETERLGKHAASLLQASQPPRYDLRGWCRFEESLAGVLKPHLLLVDGSRIPKMDIDEIVVQLHSVKDFKNLPQLLADALRADVSRYFPSQSNSERLYLREPLVSKCIAVPERLPSAAELHSWAFTAWGKGWDAPETLGMSFTGLRFIDAAGRHVCLPFGGGFNAWPVTVTCPRSEPLKDRRLGDPERSLLMMLSLGAGRRRPPMLPECFTCILEGLAFGRGAADCERVSDLYASFFEEVAAVAKQLLLHGPGTSSELAWGVEQAQHLADALPRFSSLQELQLPGHNLNDKAIEVLVEAFEEMSSLTRIDLRHNPFGREGAEYLDSLDERMSVLKDCIPADAPSEVETEELRTPRPLPDWVRQRRRSECQGELEALLASTHVQVGRILSAKGCSGKARSEVEALETLITSAEDVIRKQIASDPLEKLAKDGDEGDSWLVSTFTDTHDEIVKAQKSVACMNRTSLLDDIRRTSTTTLHKQIDHALSSSAVMNALEDCGSWAWDAIAFASMRQVAGRSIPLLWSQLSKDNNLVDTLDAQGCVADKSRFSTSIARFFHEINGLYRVDAVYHGVEHATDVMNTMDYFMQQEYFNLRTSFLDHCMCLVAGAIHDVAHPGRTNLFLTKTMSPLAIKYNDKSILENMHVSLSFETMQSNPSSNWLACLSKEYQSKDEPQSAVVDLQQYVRRGLIEMVLATDMALHSKHVRKLQTLVTEATQTGAVTEVTAPTGLDDKIFLMEIILHAADISGQCKPHDIMLGWTQRITEEFWSQGDEESQIGLPISPLCDRESGCKALPKSQLGFIDFVVQPLYALIVKLIPDAKETTNILTQNKTFWEEQNVKQAQYMDLFSAKLPLPHD